MASQWTCRPEGREIGPMSFQDLAALVREGKVTESVPVSRVGSMRWEPAWKVVGLLRTAQGLGSGGEREVPLPAPEDSVAGGQQPTHFVGPEQASFRMNRLTVGRAFLALVSANLTMVFFNQWAAKETSAFPLPTRLASGHSVDCYFPLIGYCSTLVGAFLYFSVFVAGGAATWFALKRIDEK